MHNAQLAAVFRFAVLCLIVFLIDFSLFITPYDLGEILAMLPVALVFSFFISCFFIILTMVPGRLSRRKKAGIGSFILTVLVATLLVFLNVFWVGSTAFGKLMHSPPDILMWLLILLPILVWGGGGSLLFGMLPAGKAHLYLSNSFIALGGILTLCMIPLHFHKGEGLNFLEEFESGLGIAITFLTCLMGLFLRCFAKGAMKANEEGP